MISYMTFLPEIWLVGTAILILVLELFQAKGSDRLVIKGTALIGTLGALWALSSMIGGASTSATFNGFLKSDYLSLFFRMVVLLATLLTLLMTFRFFKTHNTPYPSEFLAILLFSAAGATALSAAQEIITLYIALETLTISSYLLASYLKKDKGSNEAGMKYLLLGAFSSAVLLFGFSYLYGLTGTTVITEMAKNLAMQSSSPLAVFALILVVGGLAFKISLAPFHMWTPDVYEGAPTPVTAFLSVASKTAGFAAFVRLFWVGLNIPALQPVWVSLFAVLAAASIVIGNLEAIPQKNIKRMMAYSSIAQAGYISTGFLAIGPMGLTAMLFYLFVYLFANLGAFLAIVIVSHKTGSDQIEDYAGMWKRSPLIGVVLLVCLLSLAGVPPFAGFSGKWYLFGAAIAKGYTWLALLGMAFSVISLYYYLQVSRQCLINDAKDSTPIEISLLEKIVLVVCVVFTVTLGFWPTPLMDVAQTAATSLF